MPKVTPAATRPTAIPPSALAPVWRAHRPIVRLTKNGSAKTERVNSSQQKEPMPTMTSNGPKMIMAVCSVR
jgi:hypothetical protein